MRARTAAIWVGVAAGLGVATALWRPSTDAEAAEWVRLGFDPAAVAVIDVRHDGDGWIRVEREDQGLGWSWAVVWNGEGGAERRWPAAETRVRAGLSLLATTAMMPREGGAIGDAEAVTVRLTDRAGAEIAVLRLGEDPIGGRLAARAGEAAAWADARFADAWGADSLLAWRDERLVFAGSEPTSIELASGAHATELRRGRGRWSVVSPVAVSADATAARALLDQLARIAAARLDDRTGQGDAGLTSPAARIVLGGTAGAAWVQRMEVGGQADAVGREVFVRASLEAGGKTYGPVLGRVETERLAGIAVTGEAYARRTALGAAMADAAELSLRVGEEERAGAARGVGGWTARGSALATDLVWVATVLSEEPAARVAFEQEAGDAAAGVRLVVGGLPGVESGPIAEVELEVGAESVVARDGAAGVAWTYDGPRGKELAQRLRGLLGAG